MARWGSTGNRGGGGRGCGRTTQAMVCRTCNGLCHSRYAKTPRRAARGEDTAPVRRGGDEGRIEWKRLYSWIEGWFSDSRQALILRRRQTQHRASVENGATSPPQMTHLPRFEALCGATAGSSAKSLFAGINCDCGTRDFLRFI